MKSISNIICTREGSTSFSDKGGKATSNVELIACYLKHRLEHYDDRIITSNDEDNVECLSAIPKKCIKRLPNKGNLFEYITEHVVVSDVAKIEDNRIYLTSPATKDEIVKAINLVNKTHEIYNAYENISCRNMSSLFCGNVMELWSENDIKELFNSIDFEFTTLQNVLLIMDIIFINREGINISDKYIVGITASSDNVTVYDKETEDYTLYDIDTFEQKLSYGEFNK